MLNWKNVDSNDLMYLDAVKLFLSDSPKLLNFIFDSKKPRLRDSIINLLDEANVFSDGEQLLVKMAIDLWSGSSDASLVDSYNKLGIQKIINFCQAYKKIHG